MKFLITIFILAVLQSLANAQLANLTFNPAVCTRFGPVGDGLNYEKSWCYVQSKRTYFFASEHCTKNNMSLYKVGSSSLSRSVLTSALKTVLGGSSKAIVYVSGRSGNRCNTVNGVGKAGSVPCGTSFHFICEHYNYKQPKSNNCEKIEHLRDSSGRYLRSVCLVANKDSLESADANCVANNMKLFKVDDSKIKTALTNFVQYQLYHYTEAAIWIDPNSTQNVFATTCGSSMFSLCQFQADTTKITVPKNPDACTAKADLNVSGSYWNSACYLNKNTTWNQASNACKEIGMSLMSVTSLSNVESFLTSNNVPSVYVAGRTIDGCKRITSASSTFTSENSNCFDILSPLCVYKR